MSVVGGNSKKRPPKFKRKQIGFILKNQLEYSGVWLLKRVSPICDYCSNTDGYNVFMDTYSRFLSKKSYYIMACSKCEESFELDYQEYLKIEKIAKLNQTYKNGKLDDNDYINKLNKIIEKLNEKRCC